VRVRPRFQGFSSTTVRAVTGSFRDAHAWPLDGCTVNSTGGAASPARAAAFQGPGFGGRRRETSRGWSRDSEGLTRTLVQTPSSASPVFHLQTVYSSEVAIRAHEHCTYGKGSGGNPEIVLVQRQSHLLQLPLELSVAVARLFGHG